MKLVTVLSALALTVGPGLASAVQLYKSVGPDGRIVYSDRPTAAAKSEQTLTITDLPSSQARPYVPPKASAPPAPVAPVAPPVGSSQVQLYMADWCGYCRKAKAYLQGRGIAYQEINIETPQGHQAFAQTGSGRGIPLLVTPRQQVRGFSADSYDSLFAAR